MFNLEEIKTALERHQCPQHHQKASVIIQGRCVEIKTCCNTFELLMSQAHERQLEVQADKLARKQRGQ